MATFNAGTGNNFTNVQVADHIDNRGHTYGVDPRADAKRAAEVLTAGAAAGIPTAELLELVNRLERSEGLADTRETRAFYESFKKTVSVGGEAIRTVPGLQILLGYLRTLFP